MVHTALEAVEVLKNEGIDLEILDLRTVSPLDREAIARTVKKTNKVIILHEALSHRRPGRRNRCHHQRKKPSTISTAPLSASQALTPPFPFLRRRKNITCPR